MALTFGVLALALTAAPASANHWSQTSNPEQGDWVSGLHWGNFRWGGPDSYNFRGAWIVERTGRPDVQAALRNFVSFWNRLEQSGLFYNPNSSTGSNLPHFTWYADTASPKYGSTDGTGCPSYAEDRAQVQYFYTVVCYDRTLGHAAVGGPTASARGHIYHGQVRLGPSAFSSVSYLYTVVGHELGHTAGLKHASSREPTSIMQPAVVAGAWYDDTDEYALQVLYNHPLV